MPDSAYKNAIARRDELRAQFDGLRCELEAVEEWLAQWERFADPSEAQAVVVSQAPYVEKTPAVPAMRKPESKTITREELEPIARETILRHGRPMTRGELVDALTAQGVNLGGADKARNLGTMMWRLKQHFRNIRGKGYWPADAPLQSIGDALQTRATNDGSNGFSGESSEDKGEHVPHSDQSLWETAKSA